MRMVERAKHTERVRVSWSSVSRSFSKWPSDLDGDVNLTIPPSYVSDLPDRFHNDGREAVES